MKKFVLFTLLTLIFLTGQSVFAFGGDDSSSSSDVCKTQYPIILAHGMFATDDMFGFIDYWWGIEDALEEKGADVYVTTVNCMDTTVSKAEDFKQEFMEILAVTNKKKANIIGHSHGGIYTRYVITNLNMASKVASHTSISAPHRGSSVADVLLDILPDSGEWLLGSLADAIYTFVIGDTNSDSMGNGYEITQEYMTGTFNPNTPDSKLVFYQSWGAKIKWLTADLILMPTWFLVKSYEGENDGLVSKSSAKWGEFNGMKSGAWWCGGVSHINVVGHFFGITPGFNAPDFYVDIVKGLKESGF